MGYSVEDLVKLAGEGAIFTMSAEGVAKEDLINIARQSMSADGAVTFKNVSGFSVDELIEIANAGMDAVALEL